MPRRVQV